MIDECLDFFNAGVLTSQYTAQTMTTALAQSPVIRQKIREEFQRHAYQHPDGERSDLGKKELLMKVANFETLQDMNYLSWVIMETLRIQSPTFSTSYLMLTQDAIIGNINIRKGDTFIVNSHYLHSDGKEWQKPGEFIPERFDNTNPISKTPSGNKRNPGSWVPFAGGKRVCFGKTFAETSLKLVAIYLCHYFNFSFVDKKFETEFPVAHFGMSKRNKVEIVLTSADPENVSMQPEPRTLQ